MFHDPFIIEAMENNVFDALDTSPVTGKIVRAMQSDPVLSKDRRAFGVVKATGEHESLRGPVESLIAAFRAVVRLHREVREKGKHPDLTIIKQALRRADISVQDVAGTAEEVDGAKKEGQYGSQ